LIGTAKLLETGSRPKLEKDGDLSGGTTAAGVKVFRKKGFTSLSGRPSMLPGKGRGNWLQPDPYPQANNNINKEAIVFVLGNLIHINRSDP